MKRLGRAAGVLVGAGLFLTACGGADQAGFDSAAYEAAGEPALQEDSSSMRVEEQIIRTANVSMEVDDVVRAVSDISDLVSELDGFIQNESVNTYDGDASASITARIPTDRLDGFLDAIADFGDVTNSSVDAQDVTLEVVDLQARISTLEESISRLRALQEQASSVADLVAVEGELAVRQAELESLQARSDYLSRQVEMSTVYLMMNQRDVGPGVSPDFLGGLQNGWNSMLALTAGLITAAGFLAPFLVIAGVVTGVVFIIIGISRRKERS